MSMNQRQLVLTKTAATVATAATEDIKDTKDIFPFLHHHQHLPTLLWACPLGLIAVLSALYIYSLHRTGRLTVTRRFHPLDTCKALCPCFGAGEKKAVDEGLGGPDERLHKSCSGAAAAAAAAAVWPWKKGRKDVPSSSSPSGRGPAAASSHWIPVDSALNLSTTGWVKYDGLAEIYVPVGFTCPGSGTCSPEPLVPKRKRPYATRKRDDGAGSNVGWHDGVDRFGGFDGVMDEEGVKMEGIGESKVGLLERWRGDMSAGGKKGRVLFSGTDGERRGGVKMEEWRDEGIELRELESARVVCDRVSMSVV